MKFKPRNILPGLVLVSSLGLLSACVPQNQFAGGEKYVDRDNLNFQRKQVYLQALQAYLPPKGQRLPAPSAASYQQYQQLIVAYMSAAEFYGTTLPGSEGPPLPPLPAHDSPPTQESLNKDYQQVLTTHKQIMARWFRNWEPYPPPDLPPPPPQKNLRDPQYVKTLNEYHIAQTVQDQHEAAIQKQGQALLEEGGRQYRAQEIAAGQQWMDSHSAAAVEARHRQEAEQQHEYEADMARQLDADRAARQP